MKKATDDIIDMSYSFNPNDISKYIVSVYSCPNYIDPIPPNVGAPSTSYTGTSSMPIPHYVQKYECEICGKLIDEARVICFDCRDKIRKILDIKETE